MLWIIIIFAWAVHTQQCPYPNERCICLTSTPVCQCSYITAESTLNFQPGYQSHLVLVQGLGCLPCPYNCLQCSSPSTCISCMEQYLLTNTTCLSCPTNCRRCTLKFLTPVISTTLICSQCVNSYYLDSQSLCQKCPFSGSLNCTIDTLRSCQPSYWLDNNGASCIQCDYNCMTCSSTTRCALCKDGYYLSSWKCVPCLSYCKTCVTANTCLLCLQQGMYYDTGLNKCSNCSSGCISCVNALNCNSCSGGYILANGTCSQAITPLLNCAQHSIINSVITCSRCDPDYFLQAVSKTCYYSCSILCSQCTGAHFGLCSICQPNTYLLNRQCIAYNNIENGTAYQIYITATNSATSIISQYEKITRKTNGCLKQTILSANSFTIPVNKLQSFMIRLQWKIYIIGDNTQISNSTFSYTLTFSNTNTSVTHHFQCNHFMPAQCSFICIDKNTLTISKDILVNNQINFITNLNRTTLGFAELLIIAKRCGGLEGSTCLECSEINQCTKCVDANFFLLGQKCVQQCPTNYYLHYQKRKCYKICPLGSFPQDSPTKIKLCQPCLPECLTCLNTSTCLSCVIGFYFLDQNSSCLTSCPPKYFMSAYFSKCEKCSFPCFTCTSNRNCQSCLYGFYDSKELTCTIVCPAGYYGNLTTRECQACIEPCLTCQFQSSACITCLPRYVNVFGQCLTNCPIGFYLANTSKMECISCNESCLTCDKAFFCLSCSVGFLFEGLCHLSCPIGYFMNSIIQKCSLCPSSCYSCFNQTHCSLCKSPYALSSSDLWCLSSCNQLQYPQAFNYSLNNAQQQVLFCRQCPSTCYTCESITKCLSCSKLYLYGDHCIEWCPNGMYPNSFNLTCQNCSINCKMCISETECTQCINDMVLYMGSCLQDCPPYYYQDGGQSFCLMCQFDCSKCQNFTFCLNCSLGLFSDPKGICVDDCPLGYWPNYEYSICSHCSLHCAICTYNKQTFTQQCLLCELPYFLLSTKSCSLSCDKNQFASINGVCLACVLPCHTCVSENQCLTCKSGYGFAVMGDCSIQCPLGQFASQPQQQEGFLCTLCPSSCMSCWKSNQSQVICSQCKDGYFLYAKTGQCLSLEECIMKPSLFPSASFKLCARCSPQCISCAIDPTNCSQCINHTYLYKNQCLKQCPISYFGMNGNCLNCPQNCLSCSSIMICTQCNQSYSLQTISLQSSQCVLLCPQKHYSSFGKCKKCEFPCQKCLSNKICLTCFHSFIYVNTSFQSGCVLDCPAGTFKQTNQNQSICLECSASCIECSSISSCSICANLTALFEGYCLHECPSGMYKSFGMCISCMKGCSVCDDEYSCSSCSLGFLYEKQCVQYCPSGYVHIVNASKQNVCVSCSHTCLTCRTSPNTCTSCANSLYLYLNSCVIECINGSYAVTELRQCLSCTKPCQTCSRSDSCDTCIYGYILYLEKSRNQCVLGPLCPNSYFLDKINNLCKIQCDSSKQLTQPQSRTCSPTCPDGFVAYLPNMTCLQQCPHSNMWINENKQCISNKSSLGQQFVSLHLPWMNCTCSPWRNLLQMSCIFSIQIQNLLQLSINNLTVANMKILHVQLFSNKKGFWIYLEPSASLKIVKEWLKIQVRPRYTLFGSVNSLTKTRHLEEVKSYPLQNSGYSSFVSLFNFYSKDNRQTGQYLNEVGNGTSIAAIIIWIFCVLKNKKSFSVVWLNGLQWLYTLSIQQSSSFPPNVLHFLEGFKSSLLIFWPFTSGSPLEWGIVKKQIRSELLVPINLMQQSTLLIPIAILFGSFLTIFLFLQIMKVLIFYFDNKSSKQDLNSLEQVSVNPIAKSETSKNQAPQNKPERKSKLEILSKRVSVLLWRFHSNYIHHPFLLLTLPISILTFTQILSLKPLGLTFGVVLSCVLIVSWVYFTKQLMQNKYSLYINQGLKYYVLSSLQNYLIGFICIFGTFTLFLGIVSIISLFNICYSFSIFRSAEWKLKFWVLLEVQKILIVFALLTSYLMAEEWTSKHLYLYGWVPIVLIFLFVITLAVVVARDFFEEESIAFKELVQLEKNNKIKAKTIYHNLLMQTDASHKGPNQVFNKLISTPSLQYESQQSFFQDQPYQFYDDPQSYNGIGLEPLDTGIKENNRQALILIKQKKQE